MSEVSSPFVCFISVFVLTQPHLSGSQLTKIEFSAVLFYWRYSDLGLVMCHMPSRPFQLSLFPICGLIAFFFTLSMANKLETFVGEIDC